MMVIAPIVLTQPALTYWMDFRQTGQIGDTIGGITAPIVNLIGAVLIYFSFKEQIKANNNQWLAFEHDKMNSLHLSSYEMITSDLRFLRQDIADFLWQAPDGKEYTGIIGMTKFATAVREKKVKPEDVIDNYSFGLLGFLLIMTNTLLMKTEHLKLSFMMKANLKSNILDMYTHKLSVPVRSIAKDINQSGLSNERVDIFFQQLRLMDKYFEEYQEQSNQVGE